MIILVDTNVLCRLCNSVKPTPSDALAARHALETLRSRSHVLAIAPQNLYEFWATATRSTGRPPQGANGLGMTPLRADQWIAYFLRVFRLLNETDAVLPAWRTLVHTYGVAGYKSHDVRLVATMQAHNITNLLTFNVADFKRIRGINVLNPLIIV